MKESEKIKLEKLVDAFISKLTLYDAFLLMDKEHYVHLEGFGKIHIGNWL